MTGSAAAELVLKCGARVLVDRDTLEWAKGHRWYRKNGYVYRYERVGRRQYREVSLHRLIAGEPEGKDVHHINRDILDNRRANLVVVDRAEHRGRHRRSHSRAAFTQPPRRGSASGLKGAAWHRRQQKWQATIRVDGRNRFLGLFDDPEEAGLAYDAGVLCYRGGEGYLNFLAPGNG